MKSGDKTSCGRTSVLRGVLGLRLKRQIRKAIEHDESTDYACA
jgi:hypothetical protein